jgi:superfamily II DNA or RNA helicase
MDSDAWACLIVTNATFKRDPFQELLKAVRVSLAIVVDEVHNLGAQNSRGLLPDNAKYRLGLSATPERWFDDEGTEYLQNYFGEAVITFTLADALSQKALTPYKYYPHTVELTEDESTEYHALSRRIAVLLNNNVDSIGERQPDSGDQQLEMLMLKRARLCANAENKLKVLLELMSEERKNSHILIYCGDGRVEAEGSPSDWSASMRQVDYVVKQLAQLGMKVNRFTAAEDLAERRELRDRFACGEIQVLVAIRCLDEGFDIPATKTAFILASSTNPRQFIQRRGRVLRRSPGKSHATIHDFVVISLQLQWNDSSEASDFGIERRLFAKELNRVNEFAGLALNAAQARLRLLDLRKKYNLLDL